MEASGNIPKTVIEFLFSQHKDLFLNLATGLVHDREVAKDILSESFAAVWEHRDEIDDFYNYLYTTVKNRCLLYRRGEKIHREAYEHIARVEQGFQDFYSRTIENSDISRIYEQEIMNILYATLAEMPEEARQIFLMKKFEGKSYKEISAALGVSPARIDHTLRKVLDRLSEALKDYGPCITALLASFHLTAN